MYYPNNIPSMYHYYQPWYYSGAHDNYCPCCGKPNYQGYQQIPQYFPYMQPQTTGLYQQGCTAKMQAQPQE